MNIKRLLLGIFCSVIIWILIMQYFFCPKFSFDVPQPFSGTAFYNPYDSINEFDWRKCNFHAHSHAWHAFANGNGTAADIYRAYDSMKYAVHCVSDYQKINTDFSNTSGFIPAYEHGYNITKTHQLVLGASKVLWLDYLFPQSLDNKQNILDRLSADPNNVVIINHPGDYYGYSATDFKYLTDYNCIEVLSRFAISLSRWDSALSNGHPAFVMGNDDVHDIFLKETLGKMCTWVNVPIVNKTSVLNALKTGRSYGMIIGNSKKSLPELKCFDITHDTISITMTQQAAQIIFTGQNGKVLASYRNAASSKYVIKPEDHYIRTTIEYENGPKIFLNPVFRHDKIGIVKRPVPIDGQRTFVFRSIGMILLIGWLLMAFLLSLSKINRQKISKLLHLSKMHQ
jgi:hypothetical protein